ncbi:diguanylate cyclase domain-containing protein [Xanthobacter sediminis]
MRLFVPERDIAVAGGEAELLLLQLLHGTLGAETAALARPDRPLLVVGVGAPADGDAAQEAPRLFQVAAALRARLTIADLQDSPAYRGTRLPGAGQPLRFFASVPLISPSGEGLGALCVADTQPRAHDAGTPALVGRMEEGARVLVPLLAAEAGHAAVARLGFDLAQAEGAVRTHAAAERHYRKMYEGASALAGIGAWTLDLATRRLTWTDEIYDIFGLARGSRVTPELVLPLYDHASRRDLERLCAQAVATCGRFSLDVRIRDVRGALKWVRVSGAAEAEAGAPVRVAGFKQDITAQRDLQDRLRRQAECDALTGLASRAAFERALAARQDGPPRAVLLVGLDGFKTVNGAFGHGVGDACLIETAARLRRTFRGAELIARTGGDEFAVLVEGHRPVAELEGRARAALEALAAPVMAGGHGVVLGASAGLARAGDGGAGADLFARADAALAAAKRSGCSRLCADGPAPSAPQVLSA